MNDCPGKVNDYSGKSGAKKGWKTKKRPPEKPSDREANWISRWKMRGKSRISANTSHFYIKSLGRRLYQNWRPNMPKCPDFNSHTAISGQRGKKLVGGLENRSEGRKTGQPCAARVCGFYKWLLIPIARDSCWCSRHYAIKLCKPAWEYMGKAPDS